MDRIVSLLAAENKPYIIILDEIDHVDGSDAQRNNPTKRSDSGVLTILSNLTKSYENNSNLFFIATTNYHDKVDKKLTTRCGAFDVSFELPNIEAREKIIRFYLEHSKCSKSGVSFDTSLVNKSYIKELAKKTTDFSGRDLEEMIETAWTINTPDLCDYFDATAEAIQALVDTKVVVNANLMDRSYERIRKNVDKNKKEEAEEKEEKDKKETKIQSFLKHPLTIAVVSTAANAGVQYAIQQGSITVQRELSDISIAVQRELNGKSIKNSWLIGGATVTGATAIWLGKFIAAYGIKAGLAAACTAGAPVVGTAAGIGAVGLGCYGGYCWMWPSK